MLDRKWRVFARRPRDRRMKFVRPPPYLLAVLSGVLLGFSGPPYPTGFLAVFGLVPVLLAIEGAGTLRRTFGLAYVSSLVLLLIVTYWTLLGDHWYLVVSAILFLLAYPVVLTIPFVLWKLTTRTFGLTVAYFLFPFFWVAVEYVQSRTELTIPFIRLAHSQTYNTAAIQLTSLAGVSGLSFMLGVSNIMLFAAVRKLSSLRWKVEPLRSASLLIGGIVTAALPSLYGTAVLRDAAEPAQGYKNVRVALIQPDIDPYEKWVGNVRKQLSELTFLTQQSLQEKPDLVIWSETAIPLYILRPENDSLFHALQSIVRQSEVPVLTGYTDWIEYPDSVDAPRGTKFTPEGIHYDIFNAAMLLSPRSGVRERYYKIILLPFFEHVPYVDALGSFIDLDILRWNFGTGGYRAGIDTTVFTIRSRESRQARFGVVICYESLFSDFVASFARKGAEFIVILTNDSWWGNSAAPYQHRQFAVLRAVENRRWVVRCANGGISCVVDPYGRITAQTSFGTQAVLTRNITPSSSLTFYTRHGDWVGKASFITVCITLVGFCGDILRRRFRTRSSNGE
jgi:apolipoprotein N-acyltransferase